MAEYRQRNDKPNTRLFILGGKNATEEEFRECFGKFGHIKDIWIVHDKARNEAKGITYITYDKTSQAALALEEMNGRMLPNHPKPLKVIVASDKKDGNQRDLKEDEKMLRLFIMIPRDSTESEIKEEFEKYGEVEYVRILKGKEGSSKGLAYVKYHRPYHAAMALEECPKSYKAIFASCKRAHERGHERGGRYNDDSRERDNYDEYRGRGEFVERYNRYSDDLDRPDYSRGRRGSSVVSSPSNSYSHMGPMDMIQNNSSNMTAGTILEAITTVQMMPKQMQSLFDLIPGMEYCRFNTESGLWVVKYTSPQCAAYAKDKLNGFEYPPGYALSVRIATAPYPNSMGMDSIASVSHDIQENLRNPNVRENLSSLVESIQKATSVLQAAGLAPGAMGGGDPMMSPGNNEDRVRYCNISLPHKQPLAPMDSQVAERLFIVSQPEAFPEHLLKDCFCRFGNLIDARFSGGRNFGYVKYSSQESAQQAINMMHGQMIDGQRLKVMLADPPKKYNEEDEPNRKRPRP